jgi:hypothetical protein
MGLLQSILQVLRFNRKNWKAVVLSVLAATLFWLFNSLNKTHSANISFPLRFEYDTEQYLPVSPLPENIRLNVTGPGWELLRKSLGLRVNPLAIHLARPAEVKKIVGSSLPPLFSTQIENLQVNFVLADTLYIDLDKKVRKKLFIRIDSTDRYVAAGFMSASQPTLTPDTVWVEGPAKVVQNLPDTLFISLPARNLRAPFADAVPVTLPHASLTPIPPQVEVVLPVERYREIEMKLPVTLQNPPAGFKPQLEVAEVTCLVRIPASRYDTASLTHALAVINLKNYQRGTHKISPTITNLPPYIRVVRTDTLSVKF